MKPEEIATQPFTREELRLITHAQRPPGSLPGFLITLCFLSLFSAGLIVAFIFLYRYMQSYVDDAIYVRHGGEFIKVLPHFAPMFKSFALLTIVSFLFVTYLAWFLWRYQNLIHKLYAHLTSTDPK